MCSRNALVSPRPSSVLHRPPKATGIWIGRSLSPTTWYRCALAENGVLGNPVNRGKMTIRHVRQMTLLIWKLSRNARTPKCRLDINLHSNVGLSNVCSASATPRCPCSNDSTPSAPSTRCSGTLSNIIGFNLGRTAHSRMMNVRSSHSEALRITLQGSMESSCLINARIHYLLL